MRFFPSIIPTEAHSSHDYHPRTGEDPASSALLGEAIMDSVSSVRDSLPEQYRAHFETLRQEIIDFTKAHGIPRESLGKSDLLREATCKLSIPDLERLALLLERFEYLLKNREPKKGEIDPARAIEYVEEHYHLRKQYDFQVELLEEVGILKEGAITGIDGHKYPVPTLEQIAMCLFERRGELSTKHDQGFTKLLLVPFGMSLDSLQETLKQFLLKYKKDHPSFPLDTGNPLYTWSGYQGADIGNSPKLVYYPQFFTKEGHGGKTKMEILREQEDNQDSFPGWTVHLLQPSNSDSQDTEAPMGFASIPRQGKGTSQGDLVARPSLEANKTSIEYLSILQKAQDDEDSPYHGETSMTPEDWITAFMIHLSETGKPLDDAWNPTNKESVSCLTGAFFRSSVVVVPYAFWGRAGRRVDFSGCDPRDRDEGIGVRSSVVV
ncbi:TPA: hypothetical protein DDZ06_00735 [Candidatus Uhrbacteria bacterium]|uniref:Uncharacterized protein n=2 Tax=Candidatus Uhriibacteriota TaxID=1752732 RepID=A0A0G1Q952_9BACT|nr:MAG: hypothetical protein UX45_C0005G0022 [Candidatus Uhrbacteria bacterium GW2011_GWF2_46_218]KKU41529.1 MAG: hypothetical protein UX57_C0003G0029 [Candidatus Uhrbacteria bacterium GW2011_GWE2_46_68]HBK33529.1 hypothetical protein [Candidatus Uhrbacteria bacterium]